MASSKEPKEPKENDREKELRATAEELQMVVNEQNDLLKVLTSPPLAIATVVQSLEKSVLIQDGKGSIYEVNIPRNLPESGFLVPGMSVRLAKTGQIVSALEGANKKGAIVLFRRMVDDRIGEIESDGGVRTIIIPADMKPKKGDRLIVDTIVDVAVRNLGKDEERFKLGESTDINWDDVGGLEEAKNVMTESVELPHKHKEIFKHYGKKPAKGILLYGPPGCGKTLLAKAAATSLAKLFGAESGSLMYVKGPELLSKWVGESEATIRSLFARAKEFFKEAGYPAVLFIDEADAILPKRGSGISSDVNNTIVPSFLAEMDGMEESGCLVLLATNRPDILDPAVIRDGRVDRRIRVGRPDKAQAAAIFDIHLRHKPVTDDVKKIALEAAEELWKEERTIYRIKKKSGELVTLGMKEFVSGALIAGIVEQSISVALHRDIKNGKASGLTQEDLRCAIERSWKDQRDVDHADIVAEHVGKDDIASINRA